MKEEDPYILSENRVYATSRAPPQARGSDNLVLHWLSTIEQVDGSCLMDTNLERAYENSIDDQKPKRPSLEHSRVKDVPAQVPKLVNDKWPYLRPKQQALEFQRYRRKSEPPEKIFFQHNVYIAETLRAKKLRSLMRKRRSQSRKRKRRSVLDDLFASWNASTGVTLDKNLLLDKGGVLGPQYLHYASLANLGIDKVDVQELTSFTGLLHLDLSENHISMELLTVFSTLQKLNLQCNGISKMALGGGSFVMLEVLDLSYNFLVSPALIPLSTLPKLRKLNIDFNKIRIILEAGIDETSFPSLERLYAAGNGLSAPSLLSLSKLPKLERLCVRKNHIASIPEQVIFLNSSQASSVTLPGTFLALASFFSLGSDNYMFPFLQVLDLTSNPFKDHSSLASLRKIDGLCKVMLWDTPLAITVGYHLNGKCLPIARPILLAAMQAQREGQNWVLYKPMKAGELRPVQSEEVMSHVVRKPKPYRPVLFPNERMVEVFDRVCQREAEGDQFCHSIEEIVLGDSSSMSTPFAEEMENLLTTSQQAGQTQKPGSPKLPAFAPMLMEKELKKLQDTKIPVDPYPKEPKAHLTKLKLALQMIPCRGVQEEIDPPSYRMPTRTNQIQEHQTRLNLQAHVSGRKRALYIARRFADRAEREDQDQVHGMLEKLGQQLKDMKTRILNISNHHLNAPELQFDTDDDAMP